MKKVIYLMIAMMAISFVACEKEDVIPEVINTYAGTRWTAPDEINQWIYGGVCTTDVEFFDDYTCQEIDVVRGAKYGNGTRVSEGTYRLAGDSVYWTVRESEVGGLAKGSVMTTTAGTLSGGKMVYTKVSN